jgi:hypothetical protein
LAIPSQWSVDNYEDPYPRDTPAVVSESVPNTTTAVGLWLATFFPFWRILIFARGARYAAEKWVASSSPSARRGEDPQPRTHLHRGRVPRGE